MTSQRLTKGLNELANMFITFMVSIGKITGLSLCFPGVRKTFPSDYYGSTFKKLPWWLRQYSICLQCGRPGFDLWVGEIPWRRKWQSIPVLLPGKSLGQRSLVGYSPWCCKESNRNERLHFHAWKQKRDLE